MKTKQEQIEEIAVIGCVRNPQAHTAEECSKCIFKQGMCNAYRHAEALVQAGYGDVSKYEAEREMLGSQIKVLKQRLNNKYIEIDNLNRDYSNSFERLKAQEREIESLREDNIDLKEELYELHDELDIARATADITTKQAQIDVLNKAKEKLNSAPNGWAYTGYIDDLIEEVENEN